MYKVYVLSHTDLDGYLSAGLVEYYFKRFINEDAEFKHKSWTYGRNLPSVEYIKNNYDRVYIVDLCPDSSKFMIDLYDRFRGNFYWIDHHVKPDTEFLEKFKVFYPGESIPGIRAEKDHADSAASLTYKYFETKYNHNSYYDMQLSGNEICPIPYWLKYCSDFDCWNRYDNTVWQERIMPLFSYLKGVITNPEQAYNYIQARSYSFTLYDHPCPNKETDYRENEQTEEEIKEGQILYKGICTIYKAEAKHGFERYIPVEMNGEYRTLRAWICNTQNRSSIIFEQMENIDDYDVFIPYHFNGEKYFYSMYTYKPEIKCNAITVFDSDDWHIAKPVLTFNGHEDAAGANSEKFAFPKS